MTEQEAKEKVGKLRRFYTDAFIYAIVNLGLILIWAISGGGYFWPIWAIVGWGIGLGVHAFYLGLMPQMNAMAPFMNKDWEEKEVRRLMKEKPKAPESPMKAAPKAEPAKVAAKSAKVEVKKAKAPAKKVVKKTAKKPAKKAAAKKA